MQSALHRDAHLPVIPRVIPQSRWFYYHIENGVTDAVLTTHVETSHGRVPSPDMQSSTVSGPGLQEQDRLRFCGKQMDTSGYDVSMDVEDNT